MATRIQPGQQAGFGARKIDTGHANLGKSQLPAPGLNLRDELSSIGHPGIVGSAPTPDSVWRTLLQDETHTQALAAALARSPALGNAVLALHGDLGAGKTTLVRHLLRALGVNGRIKSPTYTVVEPHEAPWPAAWGADAGAPLNIWHFDFYRFSDPREWEDAGFRELFAQPGLKLVEWPEKAQGAMPAPDADLSLQPMDDHDTSRRFTFMARTARGQQLLAALRA
jgi:tRNA threonylcarbamoyladenosine biosynthesis protein TsaE